MYECTYTGDTEYEWDPRKAASNLRKHGIDALGRPLVVVYAWRDNGVRLISARLATPSERRRYEETP